MASIPRYVETMGADVLPAGVSRAAYDAGVSNFNRTIQVIELKSAPLVRLLQYISANKDNIIRGAQEINKKYPYSTNVGTEVGYWIVNMHGSYKDFIKKKLKKTNIHYLGHAYKNLLGALKDLQTGWGGALAAAFFGSGTPLDPSFYQKYPDAYKSEWYKNLSNSIFSDSGFLGKSKRLVQDLIYAIEKMAIDGDVTWPRNLDLPALSRIKSSQDIVQTVEKVEQVQRQAVGISTTNPDMPKFSIPKFSYPTIVPDDKPKWLLPVLVGGGALAAILALKG